MSFWHSSLFSAPFLRQVSTAVLTWVILQRLKWESRINSLLYAILLWVYWCSKKDDPGVSKMGLGNLLCSRRTQVKNKKFLSEKAFPERKMCCWVRSRQPSAGGGCRKGTSCWCKWEWVLSIRWKQVWEETGLKFSSSLLATRRTEKPCSDQPEERT